MPQTLGQKLDQLVYGTVIRHAQVLFSPEKLFHHEVAEELQVNHSESKSGVNFVLGAMAGMLSLLISALSDFSLVRMN
jgi:nitrate reductase gamma subunit